MTMMVIGGMRKTSTKSVLTTCMTIRCVLCRENVPSRRLGLGYGIELFQVK